MKLAGPGNRTAFHTLPMTGTAGAKSSSIYDAEGVALLDILCSQPVDASGPAVTDSQNMMDLLRRGCEPGVREELRGVNIPLERRLRRKVRQLRAAPAAPSEVEQALVGAGLVAGSVNLGSRRLLKIKAHQGEDEEGQPLPPEDLLAIADELAPNLFMVNGNHKADAAAKRARRDSEEEKRRLGLARAAEPTIRYAAGAPRFFFTWQGRMVVENPGRFAKRLGQEEAMKLWGAAERPIQGAVARAVLAKEVAGSSLALGAFKSAVEERFLPAEVQPGRPGAQFYPDRVLWKLRNYAGGSWTSYVRLSGWRAAPPEPGTPERPPTEVDLLCPLCHAARGDLRHVCVTCQAEELLAIREAWWDRLESILVAAKTQEEWDEALPGVGHPKRWSGAAELGGEEKWPLLRKLGWAVPTSHEETLAADLAARRPAEVGYDLAYRGVVPRSLARFLGGGTAAPVRQLILSTAEAMGVLRARYTRGVKAWAKERQRQQQAEQEPEQQQQEDLNVAGEAPLLALEEEAAAAAEAGSCTGPRCGTGLARGMEPGLIARNGLCWRCHNLNRRMAVQGALKELLWGPAGEGLAARETLLAAPVDTRTILAEHVRPAGVSGANAQHVATAMRRVGLTSLGPGGRVCDPLPVDAWNRRCKCDMVVPHQEADWFCSLCGAAWGDEEEVQPTSMCKGCGETGGDLEWCVACQAFWHAEL